MSNAVRWSQPKCFPLPPLSRKLIYKQRNRPWSINPTFKALYQLNNFCLSLKNKVADWKIGDTLSKRLRESPLIIRIFPKLKVGLMLLILKAAILWETCRSRGMHQPELIMKNDTHSSQIKRCYLFGMPNLLIENDRFLSACGVYFWRMI